MAKSTQRPIGVALIGAGMIAKTHVAALSNIQHLAQLKTVISRRPEKARHLAEFYDGVTPDFLSELSTVTTDPDVSMVIVATPPNVRIDLVNALAKAGKHILLEKPVARTPKEASDVVEICEREGVTLGVLFQHRVRTPSIAAAKLVQSGKLGQLGVVEIAVPLWRDQTYYDELDRGTYDRDGGGVMITNGIHSIDLTLSLTGPVTSVQAMTATSPLHHMEAEDFAVAGLRFANGAVGSFVASTAMFPHRTEVIRLHFENGSLRLDKDRLEISWHTGQTEIIGPEATKNATSPLSGGKHRWHQAVIEDFIKAIENNRKPLVTGRDALPAQQLIDEINRSSKKFASP